MYLSCRGTLILLTGSELTPSKTSISTSNRSSKSVMPSFRIRKINLQVKLKRKNRLSSNKLAKFRLNGVPKNLIKPLLCAKTPLLR